MKRSVFIIGFLLYLFYIPQIDNILLAHGLLYDLKMGKTLIIKVGYDGGEPMSYSEIKIYSPDGDKLEYQNGFTDANGNFAFIPNRAGKWKIVISDGMGHVFSKDLMVNEGIKIEAITQGLGPWQKLIIAISIVWGLIGTALYFKRVKVK